MRVSFDIHGVLDQEPEYFSKLIREIRQSGNEVYICTGASQTDELETMLKDLGIEYDEFLSVVDYQKSQGVEIIYDKDGDPWLEEDIWNPTKALLCELNSIDIHFDDSSDYGYYFRTPYVQVNSPYIIQDIELYRNTITNKE